MNNLLLNREYEIEGAWYAPKRFLESFKSVIDVELINTTSSAGDWDGLIFQQIKNTVYAIPFSQENNWPSVGFTIHTGDRVIGGVHMKDTNTFALAMKENIIEHYCAMAY